MLRLFFFFFFERERERERYPTIQMVSQYIVFLFLSSREKRRALIFQKNLLYLLQ